MRRGGRGCGHAPEDSEDPRQVVARRAQRGDQARAAHADRRPREDHADHHDVADAAREYRREPGDPAHRRDDRDRRRRAGRHLELAPPDERDHPPSRRRRRRARARDRLIRFGHGGDSSPRRRRAFGGGARPRVPHPRRLPRDLGAVGGGSAGRARPSPGADGPARHRAAGEGRLRRLSRDADQVAGADPDAHRARRGARPHRRARGRRRRLPVEALLAARARGAHEGDLPPHRAAGASRDVRARRRHARPGVARRDRGREARRADGEGVRPARVLHGKRLRGRLARPPARPRLGPGVPRRNANGRRACRAAPTQARQARLDSHVPWLRLQGGRTVMRSLRGRLFAATLAALAITLALTIAIGAVLTRRQVDRSQAANIARRADDLAQQRRQDVNYKRQNDVVGGVRRMIEPRRSFRTLVPNVNKSSDGEVTYQGHQQLYSYRTLPHLGLLLLRPASLQSAAWRPFLGDLLLAALVGVVFAGIASFLLARSIVRPLRRVAAATRLLANEQRPEPLAREGTTELAALADAFNQMAHELTVSRDAERAFLLSVSHELKTPLTAIRGYAEGLAEGAFDADEAARTINLEAKRLERLVRDLLDLARMNRSEFAVRCEPVDLAEVAREAVRRHEAAARQFEVSLVARGEETWVEADVDRVLQVASNLVENALRETPAGGSVTVGVDPAGKLLVSDTGPGIAPTDVPHAFERFYLYDKAGKDRPVGSGLGLAIVRQLARAMGGDVRVASGPGGTTFEVTLRLPLGPQPGRVDDFEISPGQTPERV